MRRLEGGCSCDRVRFSLKRPLFMLVCHCNACRKRTGSAYGISVVVDAGEVESFAGAITTYTRTGDSGLTVDYDFCPNCGTTVRWRVGRMPSGVVFAGGALDDTSALQIGGQIYTDDALPWARFGCELSCGHAPDEPFRAELARRAAGATERR
jgi:hypothetical protein